MTPQSLNHPVSSSASPATPPPFPPQNDEGLHVLAPTSRRRAVLFSSLVSVVPAVSNSSPASAFSIGISGPKEWLKEQKRKSSKFLLAPIYAARESLQSAYRILTRVQWANCVFCWTFALSRRCECNLGCRFGVGKGSEYSVVDAKEIQRLFRSAARDCVTQDRNPLVTFQANTGVEKNEIQVCTFTLIVNNAAVLNGLIRSFSSLNSLATGTDFQAIISSRQKRIDLLMDAISSLDKFEKGVKDCLEA